MSKVTRIIIGVVLIVAVVLVARFLIGGSEDDWICDNGQWIKHGVPAAPKPIGGCGDENISSFDDCLAAGYPAMESYPRQCRTKDEKTFVEDIGNEFDKIDLIRMDNPRPNQKISSPLIIKGQARGTWFFEGSFPINLLDKDGHLIGQTIAQAQGEWMTEEFVEFEAELVFNAPATAQGTLILLKENSSGLPQYDDELQVPVKF